MWHSALVAVTLVAMLFQRERRDNCSHGRALVVLVVATVLMTAAVEGWRRCRRDTRASGMVGSKGGKEAWSSLRGDDCTTRTGPVEEACFAHRLTDDFFTSQRATRCGSGARTRDVLVVTRSEERFETIHGGRFVIDALDGNGATVEERHGCLFVSCVCERVKGC